MIYLTNWRVCLSKKLSVADVKAHFSDCVRRVEAGSAVLITRHGKPVVALVPAAELEELERLRAAGPAGGLASLAGGWKGSEDLVKTLSGLRRTGPRSRAKLD
jgi:prevent-host-death family protein